MNKFSIISYYTEGPYEKVFYEHLWPSIKKFNLPWVWQGFASQGSWRANVALKGKFILDTLKSSQSDVVFIDADAEIVKYPQLFHDIPPEYDMAVHYLDWNTWYKNGSDTKELLSGTMFLRNNDKVKELMKAWVTCQIRDRFIREQRVLQYLLEKEFKGLINIYPLPVEYCYINSLPGGREPHVKCDPVIVHYQASRELKKVIK